MSNDDNKSISKTIAALRNWYPHKDSDLSMLIKSSDGVLITGLMLVNYGMMSLVNAVANTGWSWHISGGILCFSTGIIFLIGP